MHFVIVDDRPQDIDSAFLVVDDTGYVFGCFRTEAGALNFARDLDKKDRN